ncbi:hypothetical protein HID58_055002 [Brassica napus]|uniref:Fe2OG dioxygenase domain-containing protein n=1 Tax=Brassica napus TaxID=3708 RepID=A0ABQ8AJG1_BRANA|nr:hypothetical protein HID58_055002 [Brassica napus]
MHHTDIVALALIVTNEVPGLQVFHEGHWFDVQYVPSSITVTIGDQILVQISDCGLCFFSRHQQILLRFTLCITISLCILLSSSYVDCPEVDRVFGLRLLGLCALVASSVLSRIGLRLSNGKYKNVLHRVTVDKEKQRMSWPVFVDANPDVVIRPLPELITGDNPSMFKSIICKDFKYRRLYKLPVD